MLNLEEERWPLWERPRQPKLDRDSHVKAPMPLIMLPLRCVLFVALAISAWAGELKYFRHDAGIARNATRLPESLDAPDVLDWRMPIDSGHSTPIVSGNRIFLTTFNDERKELATVALEVGSGTTAWRKVAPAERIEVVHRIGSPAVATPACDGKRLYVFFGSHGLICYDLDGNTVWERRIGPFRDEYGAGSSPVLVGDKLIINQDHDVDSFVMALKAASGEVVWKKARPNAVRSYSTPAIWSHRGKSEVLVAGALELASYDPDTGERLWWAAGLARIVIPAPVPRGDRIYMASWAPGADSGGRINLDSWEAALAKWDKDKDGQLTKTEIDDREVLDRFYRMDLDESGKLVQAEWDRHAEVFRRAQNAVLALKPTGRGELSAGDVLWKYQRGVPYVSTPLVDNGVFWMVKDGGIVTKLSAEDGTVLGEERLQGFGGYYASPVTADGKVYFASELGVVTIVRNKREWEIVSSRNFHEKIYATPVIDSGRLLIRTDKALYCFAGRAH